MGYMSVKVAAECFGISERRVQKLCETNRIAGAQMISNVWIIPDDAQKPEDERLGTVLEDSDMLSLKQLCNELSISMATGRNWIKLGKIIPEYTEGRNVFFSKGYVQELKKSIKSGTNDVLKSRRNKKFISGNGLYHAYVSEESVNIPEIQKLLDLVSVQVPQLTDEQIQFLVAECAVQLLVQREKRVCDVEDNFLLAYIKEEISLGKYAGLIDDLLENSGKAADFIAQFPDLFRVKYFLEEKEDILGLLYISCRNIGSRKATGSYYTPTKVVKQLIGKLCERNKCLEGKRILDPCCGTGNFLLQLPKDFQVNEVYGIDIDPISVKLTRLNMALKFQPEDIAVLYEHIKVRNFLTEGVGKEFDYIVGNPPWGYAFSDEEKEYLRNHFNSSIGNNMESYDVFIEQSLHSLKKDGVLSFVLPEAVLNVKTHTPIRKIIVKGNSIQYLEFLGNAFDKVQCPCIILQLCHSLQPISCIGMEVREGVNSYVCQEERVVDAECFSFTTTDSEYKILKKVFDLQNKVYLEENATFALGIVTGKNKDYISDVHTSENEIVLKGSDINKYKVKEAGNYINFQPEQFQQVAPTEYYRAPEKLLYRFICNQLVFAYDDKQTLSLNSCNLLIPHIEGMSIKYILAILNARVAQYIFKKHFNSVKVLRSHIEQIPIPDISEEEQAPFVAMADALLGDIANEEIQELYDSLDEKIAGLYGLNEEEYKQLKEVVDCDNHFLY